MGFAKKSGWEKGIFKKHLTIYRSLWYDKRQRAGEVSEWFKELVLKTSDPARDQEFESLPLRQIDYSAFYILDHFGEVPKW